MVRTLAERLAGKVAEILNQREVVMNIGEEAGVAKGMRFAVLNTRGLSIKDPDTNEELGSVELPKVLVETVRVYPKLSVARTYRLRRENVGGKGFGGLNLEYLFGAPRWVDTPESLKTTERTYQAELDEDESYIAIGDPVVQILGDEFN